MTTDDRNPFKEIGDTLGSDSEDHPIDVVIRRRYPREELCAEMRAAFERAREAAGDDQAALIELDALFNDLRLARQEDGFNVGYDHGTVDGYSDAFLVFHGHEHSETYQTLLRGIRAMALLTDLPRALCVAAVTEAAWSLSMSMSR